MNNKEDGNVALHSLGRIRVYDGFGVGVDAIRRRPAPSETLQLPVTVLVPAGASPGMVEETSLTVVGEDLFTGDSAMAETVVVDSYRAYLPVVRRD